MVEPIISRLAKSLELLHGSLLKFEESEASVEDKMTVSGLKLLNMQQKLQLLPQHKPDQFNHTNNEVSEVIEISNAETVSAAPTTTVNDNKNVQNEAIASPSTTKVTAAVFSKIPSHVASFIPIRSSVIPKRPSMGRITPKNVVNNTSFASRSAAVKPLSHTNIRAGHGGRFPRPYDLRRRGKSLGKFH